MVDQIPVGAVDLRGVETRLPDAADPVGVRLHQLLDLVLGQRVRDLGFVGIGHGRGGHRGVRGDAVPAGTGVVHLSKAVGTLGVHELRPAPQAGDDQVVVVGDALASDRREARAVPGRRRRPRPRPNRVAVDAGARVHSEQARSAAGSLLQIPQVPVLRESPGAVRRDDDAVADHEVADRERLEQPAKPTGSRTGLGAHLPPFRSHPSEDPSIGDRSDRPKDSRRHGYRDRVAAEPSPPTIAWCGDRLRVIDQTQLPGRLVVRDLCTVDDVIDAIQRLVVRGAPALGVCGAFGVVIGLSEDLPGDLEDGRRRLAELEERVGTARPTAVNLAWAVDRVTGAARGGESVTEMRQLALEAAVGIMERDRESCRRIGELGQRELRSARRILTHCNAGRLATAGWGTALGIVYAKASAGDPVEVLATETRPLLQGARLTAWELAQAGIPVTLVTDGSVGAALGSRSVDAVVVGCDRVAANGDTANKIGTYTCALAASAAGVPFYVAGPISSFDPAISTGDDIAIELRDPDEVLRLAGSSTAAPVPAWNPAFDVTPARLITAFVTDMGVLRPPFASSIATAIDHATDTGWR